MPNNVAMVFKNSNNPMNSHTTPHPLPDPCRSPRPSIAWPPESSYIVPVAEKDSVPHASEGMRSLGLTCLHQIHFHEGTKESGCGHKSGDSTKLINRSEFCSSPSAAGACQTFKSLRSFCVEKRCQPLFWRASCPRLRFRGLRS